MCIKHFLHNRILLTQWMCISIYLHLCFHIALYTHFLRMIYSHLHMSDTYTEYRMAIAASAVVVALYRHADVAISISRYIWLGKLAKRLLWNEQDFFPHFSFLPRHSILTFLYAYIQRQKSITFRQCLLI